MIKNDDELNEKEGKQIETKQLWVKIMKMCRIILFNKYKNDWQ